MIGPGSRSPSEWQSQNLNPGQGQHSFYLLDRVKRSLRNTGEGWQVDCLGLWGRKLSGICGIHSSETPPPSGEMKGAQTWLQSLVRPRVQLSRPQTESPKTGTRSRVYPLGLRTSLAVTPQTGSHFFPEVEAAGRAFPKRETPVPKMPAPQAQGIAGKAPGGPGEAQFCH